MTAFTVQVRGTICSMQVSRFLQTMGQDSFQNKQQSQILAVIIDVHASISLDFGHASITFTGSVRQQRGVIKIVFTFVCNLKKKLNMLTNFNFLCMPGLLRYAKTTLRGLTQLPVHFTCGLFLSFSLFDQLLSPFLSRATAVLCHSKSFSKPSLSSSAVRRCRP